MTAIVTGGGTGIGRAISLALAGQGHPVAVVFNRSDADAAETVSDIVAAGGRAHAFRADVTDDAQVRSMVDAARRELGPVSVLVNNAGGTEHLPMDDLDGATDEIFERLFRLNTMAAWYCARAAAADLRAAEDGVVVNIGSIAAVSGRGSSLPYAVSKAALSGLTRSLAHALAPVRVNEVAPGLVETRWWAGREEQARTLASASMLGRETTTDDVAAVVLGLVDSRAITGQTVIVDGGQTL
jgi:3-oxoacyl-[acyl-carrier protein] reductase